MWPRAQTWGMDLLDLHCTQSHLGWFPLAIRIMRPSSPVLRATSREVRWCTCPSPAPPAFAHSTMIQKVLKMVDDGWRWLKLVEDGWRWGWVTHISMNCFKGKSNDRKPPIFPLTIGLSCKLSLKPIHWILLTLAWRTSWNNGLCRCFDEVCFYILTKRQRFWSVAIYLRDSESTFKALDDTQFIYNDFTCLTRWTDIAINPRLNQAPATCSTGQ